MAGLTRAWLPEAATIWVDMERGIYPWEGKPPRHRDGRSRVVKGQIMKDLGITGYTGGQGKIWNSPQFLKCLEDEKRRRDLGLADVIGQMEVQTGPLHETRQKVIDNVKLIFERAPDSEDPTALSPQQYVKEGREWIRYIDEIEGRFEGQKQNTIESILAEQAQTNRISAEMMGGAMELLADYRRNQDRRLAAMGAIEGEAEEE